MNIPDDIMQIAKEVVDRIAKVHVLKGDCVEDVANAILAERERSCQLLSEAEKREKEVREQALEEAFAACVAEDKRGPWQNTNAGFHFARIISALQSEER